MGRQFQDFAFKVVTLEVTKMCSAIGITGPTRWFSRSGAGALIAEFPTMCGQRKRSGLVFFVCVALFCCPSAQFAAESGSAPSAPQVAAEVIKFTNLERAHYQRATLRANARLMRAAQLQADQMARARRMAHILPGTPYPRMEDRIAAADYRWYTLGENVAFGQANAAKVIDSWMHSRGHRANILNANFTEMGAGYAVDRTGRPYYVQVFGRPLS